MPVRAYIWVALGFIPTGIHLPYHWNYAQWAYIWVALGFIPTGIHFHITGIMPIGHTSGLP